MSVIPKPRTIIDRKALAQELADFVGWEGYNMRTRNRVLDMFKAAMAKGEGEVRRRLEEDNASGMSVVKARSYLVDQIVRTLHEFAETYAYPVANPSKGDLIAIAATGGYGRAALAPHSDIDLLFLLPHRLTPHVEQVVEFMLYLLWDLGLKVGHATRSVGECLKMAEQDHTIRTALLDARWLSGDKLLFGKLKKQFFKNVVEGSATRFVEEKLAERDQRHEKMGDTRYVLEPNIKDGKGGQRDLQTLYWLAKYLYQTETVTELAAAGVFTKSDAQRYRRAENFLWSVRCHLHYLAERPEERLTFDVQTKLADRMRYADRAGATGVERFMKHYFLVTKEVGDLTRVLCAVLEDQEKKKRPSLRRLWPVALRRKLPGFEIDGGRLTVASEQEFADHPLKLLSLFHEAQRQDMDIHPNALRWVQANLGRIDRKFRRLPEANALFLEMLTSRHDPQATLVRLNEAGVFGRFIPDFGRVVAQMQYDMYHVYTVDEHTIRALGILHRIEQGTLYEEMPVSSRVVQEVSSRRALYVAVLLHDIAKGRGGDHSELGAEIALKLCPRLGLSAEETETTAWLVRHHLLMSRTAFKRNLEDAKAISDFVDMVQSPERLKLLIVLTACDIRAVGPGVWNNWKAGLLRDLYNRAMDRLSGGFTVEERDRRIQRIKDEVTARLNTWSQADIDGHLRLGQPAYWLGYDVDTLVHHANVVRHAESHQLALLVDSRPVPGHDVTEMTIYTADHPGLFSRIAGAMSLSGASIVDARVTTLSNGMALDTFRIQTDQGKAFDDPDALSSLKQRIDKALRGALRPAREIDRVIKSRLRSRTQVFTVPPRVVIDNNASRTHTVIEINGRNRMGFLHDVTAALTAQGLQISAAQISTYGERAVDVFYVKDVYGLKIASEGKLNKVREATLDAIGDAHGNPLA